jgi:hypothetical protein
MSKKSNHYNPLIRWLINKKGKTRKQADNIILFSFVVLIVLVPFLAGEFDKPDACDCNDEWHKKQIGAAYDYKLLDKCYDAYSGR